MDSRIDAMKSKNNYIPQKWGNRKISDYPSVSLSSAMCVQSSFIGISYVVNSRFICWCHLTQKQPLTRAMALLLVVRRPITGSYVDKCHIGMFTRVLPFKPRRCYSHWCKLCCPLLWTLFWALSSSAFNRECMTFNKCQLKWLQYRLCIPNRQA